MAVNEKCQTNISCSVKAVILLFSLLHIITISFCGYLLYDGMQMKKELDACKSAIKLTGLSKGQAVQEEPIISFLNSNMSAKLSANGETKQLVGGATARQKRQVRSSQPASGQVPCSSGHGGSRSDGNVRGPGRNLVGRSSRGPSCIDFPTDTASPGIVVTYIHWGKKTCTVGDNVYSGYAAGSNSGSPICVPQSNEIQSSQTLSSGPRLTALKYNLQETLNPLSLAILNNEIVHCALCRAQRDETFTVVGQTNCFSSRKWSTIYSGYLMAAESADGSTSSEPICVDGVPNIPEHRRRCYTQTLGLRLVISGKGHWLENKLVTCAVCIRSPVVS